MEKDFCNTICHERTWLNYSITSSARASSESGTVRSADSLWDEEGLSQGPNERPVLDSALTLLNLNFVLNFIQTSSEKHQPIARE